jgi:hypothetical protein
MNTSHYWFLLSTRGLGLSTILLLILTMNLKKTEKFHVNLAAPLTAITF